MDPVEQLARAMRVSAGRLRQQGPRPTPRGKMPNIETPAPVNAAPALTPYTNCNYIGIDVPGRSGLGRNANAITSFRSRSTTFPHFGCRSRGSMFSLGSGKLSIFNFYTSINKTSISCTRSTHLERRCHRSSSADLSKRMASYGDEDGGYARG